MARILIVDDDAAFREGLAETLRDLGHEPIEAGEAREGLAKQRAMAMDMVFVDFRLPGIDGLQYLRLMRGEPALAAVPVVMLTAYASSDNTIEAMKLGAFDHLTKPIGREDVKRIVDQALKPGARSPTETAEESGEGLIGNSEGMRQVQKLIGLAAGTDSTVLVTGETGTGKEMVAHALHEHGARSGKPFVAVNCAAVPAELLESELFGHVKGAFTGAASDRPGRFREADGGTLLLDEIGDMSPAMQAKILRVLQEREIAPVGAARSEKVDVRVIAATHRDLAQAVQKNEFREDLYYRLNVLPIHLPPLRERSDDIIPLAGHFLRKASHQPKSLSAAAARRLAAHAWPGNVRELKNAMERVSIVVRGSTIEEGDMSFLGKPGEASQGQDFMQGELPAATAHLEQAMIRRALREAGGNRAEAARRLGIHRQLLYAKLKEYGIES
jgi:two-component system, NtrC family, response regulator